MSINSISSANTAPVSSQTVDRKKLEGEQVKDYTDQLQQKYQCLSSGYCKLSPAYIKECALDPKKAAELERNLDVIEKDQIEYPKQVAATGAKFVDGGWTIDSKGEISSWVISERSSEGNTSKSVSLSDQMIRSNQEHLKRIEQKREQAKREEKLEELKREQKRMEEQRLDNQRIRAIDMRKVEYRNMIKKYEKNILEHH